MEQTTRFGIYFEYKLNKEDNQENVFSCNQSERRDRKNTGICGHKNQYNIWEDIK